MKGKVTLALFWGVLLLSLLPLFQNCGGEGGGVIVGNPFNDETKLLKVGFNQAMSEDISTTLCVAKVVLYAEEFYEEVDIVSGRENVVGVAKDARNQLIGEVRAFENTRGSYTLYSWFNVGSRPVSLSHFSDTLVYELEIPDGRYLGLFFEVGYGYCPSMLGRSVELSNKYGDFTAEAKFVFVNATGFEVVDGAVSTQSVNVNEFMQDVSIVQGDTELNELLSNAVYE